MHAITATGVRYLAESTRIVLQRRGVRATAGARPGSRHLGGLAHSLVKVFCTQSSPDYSMPWQNKPQQHVTGSGFIASTHLGARIFTNAHLVAHGTYIEVRKGDIPDRFEASVEAVSHDCDVAVLDVEDRSFWDNVQPLEFTKDLPSLRDDIAVAGYPTGGDNLAVTTGVVSRIEMLNYAHSGTQLLALQIDAAINHGNSGGPALKDGRVCGIAFQNLADADGIGFVIPTPIVNHFLSSVRGPDRRQHRFCCLEVKCQNMENRSLRQFCGLERGDSGVLVNSVPPLSTATNHIDRGDVLLSFDGARIANDGTVLDAATGRISFQHLASMKEAGATAQVQLLRNRQKLEVAVAVGPQHHLVYYVVGGLVFTTLTQPFLHEYGDEWEHNAPRRLVHAALFQQPSVPEQEVVIIADVLPHATTAGYQKLVELRLLEFGGTRVLNLQHLKTMVSNCTDEYFRFGLEDDRTMVMQAEATRLATGHILERYRIPAPE